MAYSPTYESSDISGMVVDFLGTYIVQLIAFAALFALAFAVGYLLQKGKIHL